LPENEKLKELTDEQMRGGADSLVLNILNRLVDQPSEIEPGAGSHNCVRVDPGGNWIIEGKELLPNFVSILISKPIY